MGAAESPTTNQNTLREAERSKVRVTVHYGDTLKVSGVVEHVVSGLSGRVYIKSSDLPCPGLYTIPLKNIRRVDVG